MWLAGGIGIVSGLAALPIASLGQSAIAPSTTTTTVAPAATVSVNAIINGQTGVTPPTWVAHNIEVTCQRSATFAAAPPPTVRTLTFFTSGVQTFQLVGSAWSCYVSSATVPGYSRNDVGIDWGGQGLQVAGYFIWRRTLTPPSGCDGPCPVTTLPPVRAVPAIQLIGVDFGSQLSGVDSAPRDAIVRNTGAIPVTYERVEIADPFLVKGGSCAGGQPIAPGGECSISLIVKPPNASVVERTATVFVTSTGGAARAQAAMRVQGSDVENLSVGGASFGTVAVGATSGQQTVQVVNAGSLVVRISRIAVTPPFAVVPGGSCGIDVSLPPRGACTVQVVYTPTAGGAQNGQIDVTAISVSKDLVGSGQLSGTGDQRVGQLSVTPPSIDFGAVPVGTTSKGQTVTVTNTGNAPIAIAGAGFSVNVPANRRKKTPATTRLTPSAKGFSVNASKCKAALAPGASCTINVVARPGARGPVQAGMEVRATGATAGVSLSVRGSLRGLRANPAAVSFPVGPVGAATAPVTVTITNVGDDALTLASIAAVGGQLKEVVVDPSTCANAALAPNATCTVIVRANPAGGGARTTSLVVTAATKERVAVPLKWSVLAGKIAVNPAVMDLGTGAVGSTTPAIPGEVRNVGKVPVVITAINKSGPNVVLDNACIGKRLEPGQACALRIAGKITRAGANTGAVSAVGSAGEKAAAKVVMRTPTPVTTATTAPPATIPVGSIVTTPPPPVTVAPSPVLLELRPATGEIGQPATAKGTGYPANADVELQWADGVKAGVVRTDATGAFTRVVLPLPGQRIGPTELTGTAVSGGATANAPYLLKFATYQPQGRNRNLVNRS
jgi:hypothetical protein